MRLAMPSTTSFWVCILAPFLTFAQSAYQLDNFQNGKQYHQNGELVTAIDFYTKALIENSAHTKALYNRGIAYYQMENFEAAKQDFENLVALLPNDMESRQNLATIEFMTGHFLDALNHYNVIIQQQPTGEIYAQRALVKTYLQMYPEALSDLQIAIQYAPDDPLNFVHQGDVYTEMAEYEQAIYAYSQAINLRVEDAAVFNNRANAKASMGAYQEAIYDYNNAILVRPESHFFSNRANCHLYLGKPEATIADAKEALRINPDNDEAYYFMGLALLNSQYYEEALVAFNQAIQLNPEDGEYYGQRGVAQYMMQQFQAAIQDFEQAVAINPELSESYRLLEMTQAEIAYRPQLTEVVTKTPTGYYQSVDPTLRSRSIYPQTAPVQEEAFEVRSKTWWQ